MDKIDTMKLLGVWGTVAAGWLQAAQPWLTGLAAILAAVYTAYQLHDRIKYGPRRP